jgi:TPR repeat protein
MGVTVQLFFHVTLITASAAVTSWLLGMVYVAVTGDYMYVDTAIPIAVFLGMNLLVTDPASSPQSNGGKILFGAVYAVAVFFTYDVLRDLSRPAVGDDPGFYVTWLDKLLFLPFLNLAVPLIDAIGRRLTLRRWWTLDARRTNWVHVGAWIVFFGCMLGDLRDSPGKDVTFWAPKCEVGEVRACENIVSLYHQDCEGEIGASCHNLGVIFEHGDGVAEDLPRAAGAYFKGCEFAFAPACRHLGVLIWTGRALGCSVEAGCDDKGAAALFARACELGDPGGCTQYGVSLTLGRGVSPDPAKAAAQLQRACDGGHGPGCVQLGNARLTGRGVSQDKAAAARLYDKACAVGEDVACTNLAAMKWLGDGVPVDREAARRGLDAACGRGFAPACAQRERLLRGPPR